MKIKTPERRKEEQLYYKTEALEMSKYYTPAVKGATLKYMKDKQVRVPLNWKKEEFEEYVKPCILRSGESVSTFIKKAVLMRIKNENLDQIQEDNE